MFERYTEKARRVIFFARYEAGQFGSPYIESEHLLLGLLRESKALSGRILSGPSFTVDDLRKEVEKHATVGKKIPTSVDLPISNECRSILRYAADEADRLGHKHIGTEHLLAGMLLERDCYAARLLREHGVSLESVRSEIQEEPTRELAQAKSPGIPAGYRWKNLIYNAASENVVIEMARKDTGHLPMSRLFARHKDAAGYEPVGNPADDVSYESPVTCEKQPIVIFNSMKWAGGGGNPDGVYLFNLKTKELTVCTAKDALIIAAPHLRSWISTLVSLSDDGQTLYVKVGIEKPVSGGGVVEYHLASLALLDKKMELLSQLKDIRF
ncbi:MAG: Clp protease N-terminal domain-containing protein [Terriglobales bacterium]